MRRYVMRKEWWLVRGVVRAKLGLCLVRVGSEYTPSIPMLSQTYVEEYRSSTIASRILRGSW